MQTNTLTKEPPLPADTAQHRPQSPKGPITTIAALATLMVGLATMIGDGVNGEPSSSALGLIGALLAVGWFTADVRRVQGAHAWQDVLLFGSNWAPTTVMLPIAALAGAIGFGAPPVAVALGALAIAYWMVTTWRRGAIYAALGLVGFASLQATRTPEWIELGLGGLGAGVLMVAAQLRVRAKDHVAAVSAGLFSAVALLIPSASNIVGLANQWSVLIVVVGAWVLSWIVEADRSTRPAHLVDWIGRSAAVSVLVATALRVDPVVGLSLCAGVAGLIAVDYLRERRRLSARADSKRSMVFATMAGTIAGLAAGPVVGLTDLASATAGVCVAVGGFVAAGVALGSPRSAEVALGAVATTASVVGLLLASADGLMFGLALMAVGSTMMFAAAAYRHLGVGVAGYAVVSAGFVVELLAF